MTDYRKMSDDERDKYAKTLNAMSKEERRKEFNYLAGRIENDSYQTFWDSELVNAFCKCAHIGFDSDALASGALQMVKEGAKTVFLAVGLNGEYLEENRGNCIVYEEGSFGSVDYDGTNDKEVKAEIKRVLEVFYESGDFSELLWRLFLEWAGIDRSEFLRDN